MANKLITNNRMILGLLILISFAFITNPNNKTFRKFKITKHWPMRMKERGDYFPYLSYNYIITHKDYILYEFPQDGEFNDTLPNEHTYFQLGIHKKGDTLCYFTDPKKQILNEKRHIDTLLGNHGYFLKPIIDFDNHKLISEQKIENGKKYNLIRKYIILNKKNISYADTVKVYFSNNGARLPIPLFTKEFILENKLDLAKFEFIYNPRRYPGDERLYPRSILSMSIDEIKIDNTEIDRYSSYFEFFEKLLINK